MATIGLIAPAGNFNNDRLEKGISLLESWGHQIQKSPNLYAQKALTAGTAQERAEDLLWALNTPEIDLIIYARGGYGTCELLELLDLHSLPYKPILGFSDATVLGSALYGLGRAQFVHAPVLHSLADHTDSTSQQAIKAFLDSEKLPSLKGKWSSPPQEISGPLFGGNLCMLTTLMGTPWQPKTSGTILLLEEIGEPAYKIKRMLSQLRYGGLFDEIKAIGFGSFSGCPFPSHLTLYELLEEIFSPLGIPMLIDLPFGHGHENLLWQVGREYTITSQGILTPLNL